MLLLNGLDNFNKFQVKSETERAKPPQAPFLLCV